MPTNFFLIDFFTLRSPTRFPIICVNFFILNNECGLRCVYVFLSVAARLAA